MAHQRDIAARAERKREGIEQDGFAGAGLAGEHRQTGREVDVEPVDQDDVANREPGQHAGLLMQVACPDPLRASTPSRFAIIKDVDGRNKSGREVWVISLGRPA